MCFSDSAIILMIQKFQSSLIIWIDDEINQSNIIYSSTAQFNFSKYESVIDLGIQHLEFETEYGRPKSIASIQYRTRAACVRTYVQPIQLLGGEND